MAATECPVCLEQYDARDRAPNILLCGHNVCGMCLGKVVRGHNVQCPTCRGAATLGDTKINFGLRDVVAERCEECHQADHKQKCHHCNLMLCDPCTDQHAVAYHKEVQAAVESLRAELKTVSALALDQSAIEQERRKEEETVLQAEEIIEYKRREMDTTENDIKHVIKRLKDTNIGKHRDWIRALDAQADQCKSLVLDANEKLGIKHTQDCTISQLSDILSEVRNLHCTLNQMRMNTPILTDYKFMEAAQRPQNIGTIIYQTFSAGDYEKMACKATTGSRGSGQNQFKDRARVACMEDRIVVADSDNHRIKLYDENLNLLSVIGEEGHNRNQFNYPGGVCVMRGEVFVSDHDNHRIKVFNEHCYLQRMFGSRGAGETEFDRPLGLAAGPQEELFVCDTGNYRIKVVNLVGEFIREIGCKGAEAGQFKDSPQRVAVTSDGVVMVTDRQGTNVHMFKSDGEFLGLFIEDIPATPKPLRLTGIAVDQKNNVILAENNNHKLLVFDSTRELVCTVGESGSQEGQLDSPWEVCIDMDGRVVVYEARNYRIQMFQIDN